MTLNNSMMITPLPPAQSAGKMFKHGSVLDGKTFAYRVNSQRKSTPFSFPVAWTDTWASGPQAWLADILSRIGAHPAHRLDELLPWNWKPQVVTIAAHAA
jgi:hypothetical protein